LADNNKVVPARAVASRQDGAPPVPPDTMAWPWWYAVCWRAVGSWCLDGRWKLTGNVLEMLIKYPPQAEKILACLGVFGRLE
jgi:hypothetical protein